MLDDPDRSHLRQCALEGLLHCKISSVRIVFVPLYSGFFDQTNDGLIVTLWIGSMDVPTGCADGFLCAVWIGLVWWSSEECAWPCSRCMELFYICRFCKYVVWRFLNDYGAIDNTEVHGCCIWKNPVLFTLWHWLLWRDSYIEKYPVWELFSPHFIVVF